MRRVPALLVVAVLGVGVAACGDGSEAPTAPATTERAALPSPAPRRRERPRRPPAPRCAANAANCETAAGRVIALESVDADGDGDLHLILASGDSITLPGVSVLDISKDLRPRRDPRPGDWAAGAGPVFRGSYGQRQIEVERVVYSPRR